MTVTQERTIPPELFQQAIDGITDEMLKTRIDAIRQEGRNLTNLHEQLRGYQRYPTEALLDRPDPVHWIQRREIHVRALEAVIQQRLQLAKDLVDQNMVIHCPHELQAMRDFAASIDRLPCFEDVLGRVAAKGDPNREKKVYLYRAIGLPPQGLPISFDWQLWQGVGDERVLLYSGGLNLAYNQNQPELTIWCLNS